MKLLVEQRESRLNDGQKVYFPHRGKWGKIVRWPSSYRNGPYSQDSRYYMDCDGWRWSVSEKEVLTEAEYRKLSTATKKSLKNFTGFWFWLDSEGGFYPPASPYPYGHNKHP